MITLFGYAHFFTFLSFLLYQTEVESLKCAMLGAFTVYYFRSIFVYSKVVFFDFSLTVKAAPHECVVRFGQP